MIALSNIAIENQMIATVKQHELHTARLEGNLAQEQAKTQQLEDALRQMRAHVASIEHEKEQWRQERLESVRQANELKRIAMDARQRREVAELAAEDAARAAAAAAKAACEATAPSPRTKKRPAEEMTSTNKKARFHVFEANPSLAGMTNGRKLGLAEARRQAAAEMEKRIGDRVNDLKMKKKQKEHASKKRGKQ
jgi:hypothetical protein